MFSRSGAEGLLSIMPWGICFIPTKLQQRNLPDVVALLFFEAKKRDVITLTIHFCFGIDILVLTWFLRF